MKPIAQSQGKTAGAEAPELKNVTAAGTPPQKRVGSALAAKRIYDDLSEDSVDWAASRARIQAVYDGNAPFKASDLTRLGQSHRCNVNFREMEAIIDSNAAAAWSLHMDIGPMIDAKIDSAYLPTDGTGMEWTDIVAEEYTRTLLEWPSFYYNVDQVTKDCFKYGCGGKVWVDEWDWRSKAFQIGNLKVPARMKCDPEKQDLFCLDDEYTIHEMYKLVEDRATSEKAGWNVAAIKEAMVKIYKDHSLQHGVEDKERTSDWESLQAALRAYDPDVATMDYEAVKVVHLIVKEATPDKGISHYIFASDVSDEDAKFLFEKQGRFKKFQEVLWLLPHNYGDGAKIRSIKALGHRSLLHCEFSNRFLCQLFDSGMLASSLIVKRVKAADMDEMQMLRMGAVTVIPEAMEPVQTSFIPKMDALVGLRTMSRDILLNNTGVYRPRTESAAQQTAYPTAQQVMQEAKTQATFEHSQATFFYVQWQGWHQETFRRLTRAEYLFSRVERAGQREAQGFIMRCLRRGIPPHILLTPGVIQVYSARALGMGSSEERKAITNQLVLMKGGMDEKGRRWVDRQWAATRIGYWNADKVFPVDSRDSIPGNATSLAVLENNSILDGRAAVVGSDQPHALHATAHMAMIARYAEAFVKLGIQGIPNLSEAANAFKLGMPHLQEHVQALSQDPTRREQVDMWVKTLTALAPIGQAILKAADEAMAQQVQAASEQQEQGQQMTPEMQLKMQEMMLDFQLENKKQDSLNQMRSDKTSAQMQIRAGESQMNTQLSAQRVQAEIEIAKAKAEANIALEQAKQASKGGG